MNLPADQPATPPQPDPIMAEVPNEARRYNYLLGGRTNFRADRDSADAIAAKFPTVRLAAQENRRFLHRAVTVAAGDLGIRQFLDIGTGIPEAPHVHDLAQRIHPDARAVYVDHDPVVRSHAHAFLHRPPHTAFVKANLRNPAGILTHPDLRATLDLEQPVAVLLVAVAHFLTDDDDPYTLVDELMQTLVSGSCLILSHVTFDLFDTDTIARMLPLLRPNAGHGTFQPRKRIEVEKFFDRLAYVRPGLVPIVQWRPDIDPAPAETATPASTGVIGAVARRP